MYNVKNDTSLSPPSWMELLQTFWPLFTFPASTESRITTQDPNPCVSLSSESSTLNFEKKNKKFKNYLINDAVPAGFQSTKWKWRDVFFKNGGLLTYASVSQIFEFGFGTRVRSLPDALRLAIPKKRLPGCPKPSNSGLDAEDLLAFLLRERCKWGDSNL